MNFFKIDKIPYFNKMPTPPNDVRCYVGLFGSPFNEIISISDTPDENLLIFSFNGPYCKILYLSKSSALYNCVKLAIQP